MSKSRRELFRARITRGPGCWEHSGSRGSHNYPQATGPDGRSQPAHRVAWLFGRGPIPAGAMVLHRCNNKACVRLAHLYLGTHKQNMDDVARVGHPRRKLTSAQARKIRTDTRTQREIAHAYGVSTRAVWNIRSGVTYRHA